MSRTEEQLVLRLLEGPAACSHIIGGAFDGPHILDWPRKIWIAGGVVQGNNVCRAHFRAVNHRKCALISVAAGTADNAPKHQFTAEVNDTEETHQLSLVH